jgi:hypothetical protein
LSRLFSDWRLLLQTEILGAESAVRCAVYEKSNDGTNADEYRCVFWFDFGHVLIPENCLHRACKNYFQTQAKVIVWECDIIFSCFRFSGLVSSRASITLAAR